MAPLKVIGAGFGRTGTDSLRTALNMLGYHTHHMKEMGAPNRHPELILEALSHPDKHADWDLIYEEFDAAVDWPTVAFLDRVFEKYPDCKVLLTVRDADSWYRSFKNTIYQVLEEIDEIPMDKYPIAVRNTLEVIRRTSLNGELIGKMARIDDEEAIKGIYNAHNEWVKKTVPADRLLVMELGEGWERLCKFLDKPVPSEPFPRVNSTRDFNEGPGADVSIAELVQARLE